MFDANGANQCASSYAFAIESRINIGLREGRHILKDMSYKAVNQPNGVAYHSGGGLTQFEEFNYNNGYSTDDLGQALPAYPYPFLPGNEFDNRMRWSPTKIPGEQEDKFRQFPAANYQDAESGFGYITNVRSKFNRLIYWQEDAVGYMPIHERQLDVTEFGDAVQIGIGGVFDRFDEIIDMIGNQHQWGLVEHEFGFHWYDSKRTLIVFMDRGMQITQDSIVKGMNNLLHTGTLPAKLEISDNVFTGYGITSGYDPVYKQVLITFKQYVTVAGDADFTVVIDQKLNAYMGKTTMCPRMYITYKDLLFYTVSATKGTALVNQCICSKNTGTTLKWFNSDYEDAWLKLVVKDPDLIEAIFDNFVITGNENFFSEIEIYNGIDTVTEDIVNATNVLISRDVSYRNGKWYGSFARSLRQRLDENAYLVVKFTVNDNRDDFIRFVQMITKYRKAY